MASPTPPPNPSKTILAIAQAGIVLGVIQAVKLGALALALVVIPLFAATAVLWGGLFAAIQRASARLRGFRHALAVSSPVLLLAFPVSLASASFQGAYAQTLPLLAVARYGAPFVTWVFVAVAWSIASRATARWERLLLAVGASTAIVVTVTVERHVLHTQYPALHTMALFAVLSLVAVVFGALQPTTLVRPRIAATVFVIAALSGVLTACFGLQGVQARRGIADIDSEARDLVRFWRNLFDFDRDGSSKILGGGDCDDLDAGHYPGAPDRPGDGVDSDCNGRDSNVLPAAPVPTSEALAAWRDSSEVQALLARTREMNVLIISVDALRSDFIKPGAGEFPNLEHLLASSVLFDHAFAPAPVTAISLGALVTGRVDPFQRVKTTLPEAMSGAGRPTIEAIPEEVFRRVSQAQLSRGFSLSLMVQDHGFPKATLITSSLSSALQSVHRPWFAWAHYFDVHDHWKQPGGQSAERRYRNAIASVDSAVGALLAGVKEASPNNETIVIFVSDHGESLNEEARLESTHGTVVYPATVRIPFAIKVPGITPGTRNDIVSMMDVAPTLVTLAGLERFDVDGVDLAPALLNAPRELRAPDRPLVIQAQRQWGVVQWPYYLVCRLGDNLLELYNLEDDPLGHHDLSEQRPEAVDQLVGRYGERPPAPLIEAVTRRAWREQQAAPVVNP